MKLEGPTTTPSRTISGGSLVAMNAASAAARSASRAVEATSRAGTQCPRTCGASSDIVEVSALLLLRCSAVTVAGEQPAVQVRSLCDSPRYGAA